MTDYTTSVEMQDRLLERPVNETSSRSIPISTRYGYVLVTQQGPSDRAVIVTYHDVGYNCMNKTNQYQKIFFFLLAATQFQQFFAFNEMMPITEHFTIYHINAPGQEDRANPLPAT